MSLFFALKDYDDDSESTLCDLLGVKLTNCRWVRDSIYHMLFLGRTCNFKRSSCQVGKGRRSMAKLSIEWFHWAGSLLASLSSSSSWKWGEVFCLGKVFSFFFWIIWMVGYKKAYVTNLQSMSQDKLLKSQQASCHMRFDKQGSFHSQPRGPRQLWRKPSWSCWKTMSFGTSVFDKHFSSVVALWIKFLELMNCLFVLLQKISWISTYWGNLYVFEVIRSLWFDSFSWGKNSHNNITETLCVMDLIASA